MKQRLFITILAAMLCVYSIEAQSPKREMRSTWIATVWAIDWPSSTTESKAKAQMTEYLDHFAEHNFTGICFQVRGMADAMYKSSYEPWSSAISGTRGKDPGWDPLAWVVEECHARGLECYAWVNPYRISSNATGYSTTYDTEWKNNGWVLSNGSYTVFNPGLAEARAHILRVIKEIYTNYAIDGMLFDDYFYPSGGTSEGTDAPDYAVYKNSGTTMSIGDWRRQNVNDFMKEIYDNIQTDRPDMRFGIAPAGVSYKSAASYGLSKPSGVTASDWQYDQIYSDPLAWMAEQALDFISPQLYWTTTHSTAPFGPLTTWWANTAEHFGCHFYSSHSISLLASDNTTANWADIAKQVTLHRGSCTSIDPGEIFYSAKNIDGMNGGAAGLGDYLQENVYQGKSLTPRISWKTHPTYAAPSSGKKSGSTLSWAATSGSNANSIIRYTVYAIPSNIGIDDAKDGTGDGIDGQYLIDVSYATSYSIPTEKQTGYYYAVCVYDGYGFESEPTLIGYDAKPSTATTLVSPAEGASVDVDATFTWTAVSNATYKLEISENSSFSPLAITREGLTGTSVTLNIAALTPESTCYWRVVTTQPDCYAVASDYRSFVTPKAAVGNFEHGYTIVKDPATYAKGDYELTSLWLRSINNSPANYSDTENGSLNRGMVATPDYVYVSGREEVSSTSPIYLRVYDAATGEHIKDLELSSNGQTSYLPCNDVIKDTAGNICITNLTLNCGSTALKIHLVDTTTGKLTEVASLTGTEGRIDHAAIYGDVTSSSFFVFAGVASSNVVYRWTVPTGNSSPVSMTAVEFMPTASSHFGIAPKVLPTTSTAVYVDGHATVPAQYNMSTGKIGDSPASGATFYPTATPNGMARFSFDSKYFMVFAGTADGADGGYRHYIVNSTNSKVLTNGSLLWSVPEGGLGTINSTTMSAPCDAVVGESSVNIYTYSPGNGLAAYALTKSSSGVDNLTADTCRMRVSGSVVMFDTEQSFIKAYSLTGALVAQAENAYNLELPSSGVYIIVTDRQTYKVSVR